MARQIYVFDPPDQFVAGAVGQPGDRTFYLQARKREIVISVALEKTQVAALAERLLALAREVRRRGVEGLPASSGGAQPRGLEEPIRELFRVGTMTLGWDGDDQVVVVEARAQQPDGDEEPEEIADDDPQGPDLIRVRMPLGIAEAFAERALEVVAAGRPPCPLCGQPLDPQGHLCPRRDGYVH
ncbi:MAG: DUF3090 family protein [Chloroflexota bacterium]|nr:DUF3090 family protein [Chloroflexota bacterium]